MTRRLTIALVGVAAMALVFAGLGTLILSRVGARSATESNLRAQVTEVRDEVEAIVETDGDVTETRVERLRRLLDLESLGVEIQGRGGRSIAGSVPGAIPVEQLDLESMAAGAVESGWTGRQGWAATAITFDCGRSARATAGAAEGESTQCTALIGVSDSLDLFLGRSVRWFLLSSAVVLVLAALAGRRLARRLTAPLVATEATTRRLAADDLSARVAVPPGNDELASLARSVNAMAEHLDAAKASERQFLLSVSHDLRTPLTSIRGYAEALADGTLTDPVPAGQVIGTEAARLERLVSDLLDLARLDARSFSVTTQVVDVAPVVLQVAAAIEPRLVDAGLRLVTDAPSPAWALADPQRLGQVVANLADNAVKHARSTVTVRVEAAPDWIAIHVDDDGAGIDPDDIDRVFDRLWTSDRRQNRPGVGSGLGLAIGRELTIAMGGRVDAGPSPSGGARLSVNLPAAPAPS